MEQAGSLLRKIRECIAEFFGKLLDRRTAIAIDRNSGWVAKRHIIALEAGIAISVKVQRPARYDYLLQIWQELNTLLESFCRYGGSVIDSRDSQP